MIFELRFLHGDVDIQTFSTLDLAEKELPLRYLIRSKVMMPLIVEPFQKWTGTFLYTKKNEPFATITEVKEKIDKTKKV